MKIRPLAILLMLPLWACADKPGSGAATGSSAVSTTLSVIETPFLIAFKVPVCVATVPLMGPGAIASAAIPFKDSEHEPGGWQLMTSSVEDACGPPYVATPHYGME